MSEHRTIRQPAPLALAISATLALATISIEASAQLFPPTMSLSTLDGSNGFRLDGVSAIDYSGNSVSAAGDINGDGLDDLIVGASHANPAGNDSGSSYVVFGHASSNPFSATMSLADLDGSNGFRLDGAAEGDISSSAVSAAGDINGDGLDDLIVGAFKADSAGVDSGSSYVVFGRSASSPFPATLSLASLDGSTGFRLDGESAFDYSGISVSAAGDVNGDGLDDLIVGASSADSAGMNSGSSYVVFGRASSSPFPPTLALASLNGSTGFRLDGELPGDYSGASVSAAGDVNGDGFDDLIIGAPGSDPAGSRSGSSYVVFGRASSSPFPATLSLASLNGNNGFLLTGVATDDTSGRAVSAVGDINGDGVDDLIVGADRADPAGSQSGSSYVVFGRTASNPFPATLPLLSLDGSNGFRLDGVAQYDNSGTSVSAAGDVNGDSLDDLIVGAPNADPAVSYSGSSYVVFGRATGNPFPATLPLSSLNGSNGFRLDGVATYDGSGAAVSEAGDVNGDGLDDLIIGAPGSDPAARGSSYVVFGRIEDAIFADGFDETP